METERGQQHIFVFPRMPLRIYTYIIAEDTNCELQYTDRHRRERRAWLYSLVPMAAGDLAWPGSLLEGLALKHKITSGALALAWMLKRSPVMLPA
ncbi:MAG TPA: hypothetical protein VGD98_04975 [Ktedonobacteraceae bacterium]